MQVDGSFDAPVPADLRPLAWWAIDTHTIWTGAWPGFEADLSFAARRPRPRPSAGPDQTAELPLACDPAVHRPDVPKRYDFAFVGNIPRPWAELLAL